VRAQDEEQARALLAAYVPTPNEKGDEDEEEE
jgi:hypothetical protein